MRKLPPLRALQVFETAARHLHFSRAGDELCITQSAVSHQIRLLEQFYGFTLFERQNRQLQLTAKGLTLFELVTDQFDSLQQLSSQLKQEAKAPLRLAVYSSFAVKWLIPRLTDFKRNYPDIHIRLEMMSADPLLNSSVADMFITGKPDKKGYYRQLLHKERLIAVASPLLVTDISNFTELELYQYPLLCVDEIGIGLDWLRWQQHFNLPEPLPHQHIFSHMLLALEAAIAAQGIALVSDFIVEKDITSGKLIQLPLPVLETGFDFYFCTKQSRIHDRDIATFANWIKQAH
ncbi:LysR substrate-binding domain-containing protein [Shewanella marina]|uniref:LysR substrate-binding domain-containing protein n=1 Tax=Shewanella marina TaxID=487319 RepID=UPI00046F78C6|nr:LysR substrate-binding domain-containing protein [Shewanella marina]